MPKIPPTALAVSPRDAARIAGVSRSRIYELINSGELPAYKDGSRTLILVADIEAWLARLRPMPKSGWPIGPLLPAADRKLARKKVRDSTEPFLPVEQEQRAIERASEPPAPIDQQLPSVELEPLAPDLEPEPEPSPPDLAGVCIERFKLIVPNVGPDEARLRAFEHAVGVCRGHYGVDQETGKRMVSDAIKAARTKGPPLA